MFPSLCSCVKEPFVNHWRDFPKPCIQERSNLVTWGFLKAVVLIQLFPFKFQKTCWNFTGGGITEKWAPKTIRSQRENPHYQMMKKRARKQQDWQKKMQTFVKKSDKYFHELGTNSSSVLLFFGQTCSKAEKEQYGLKTVGR